MDTEVFFSTYLITIEFQDVQWNNVYFFEILVMEVQEEYCI